MTHRTAAQMDLLSWQPPAPVARFEPDRVRAASLPAKITRLVAEVLREQKAAGRERDQVAEAMSAYLGEAVSLNVLNSYASEAREEHIINLPRFIALLAVTQDKRPLHELAALFGWAVIDRKFLPVIELAALREHQDDVKRRTDALRHQARLTGAL
jgi:hypothetical protein